MSSYLSSAPNRKQIADLTSFSVSRPTISVPTVPSNTKLLIPSTKPIASIAPDNVFNPDSEMIGEFITPLHSLCFKGISDLLPPKQKAPENNSGKLPKIKSILSEVPFHLIKDIIFRLTTLQHSQTIHLSFPFTMQRYSNMVHLNGTKYYTTSNTNPFERVITIQIK